MDEWLKKYIGDILGMAIKHGFEPPLYMVAVSIDGSVVFFQFSVDVVEGRPVVMVDVLTSHISGDGPCPINIILTDVNGKAGRILIEEKQTPRPQYFFNGEVQPEE